MIDKSYSLEEKNDTSNIGTVTIPTVCDEEECMPQIFVSIPINQTQLSSISENELNTLKEKYVKEFGDYLYDSFIMVKSHGDKPIKPSSYCKTLPEPGCHGKTKQPDRTSSAD